MYLLLYICVPVFVIYEFIDLLNYLYIDVLIIKSIVEEMKNST